MDDGDVQGRLAPVSYNDWWKLYDGASLTMSASIDGCPGAHNYTPACIISSDTKNVTLPMSLNPGY